MLIGQSMRRCFDSSCWSQWVLHESLKVSSFRCSTCNWHCYGCGVAHLSWLSHFLVANNPWEAHSLGAAQMGYWFTCWRSFTQMHCQNCSSLGPAARTSICKFSQTSCGWRCGSTWYRFSASSDLWIARASLKREHCQIGYLTLQMFKLILLCCWRHLYHLIQRENSFL
jgi:hypothetical protein